MSKTVPSDRTWNWARYWDWLIDYNGIEKMFHTYNFSVGLHRPDPDTMSWSR